MNSAPLSRSILESGPLRSPAYSSPWHPDFQIHDNPKETLTLGLKGGRHQAGMDMEAGWESHERECGSQGNWDPKQEHVHLLGAVSVYRFSRCHLRHRTIPHQKLLKACQGKLNRENLDASLGQRFTKVSHKMLVTKHFTLCGPYTNFITTFFSFSSFSSVFLFPPPFTNPLKCKKYF